MLVQHLEASLDVISSLNPELLHTEDRELETAVRGILSPSNGAPKHDNTVFGDLVARVRLSQSTTLRGVGEADDWRSVVTKLSADWQTLIESAKSAAVGSREAHTRWAALFELCVEAIERLRIGVALVRSASVDVEVDDLSPDAFADLAYSDFHARRPACMSAADVKRLVWLIAVARLLHPISNVIAQNLPSGTENGTGVSNGAQSIANAATLQHALLSLVHAVLQQLRRVLCAGDLSQHDRDLLLQLQPWGHAALVLLHAVLQSATACTLDDADEKDLEQLAMVLTNEILRCRRLLFGSPVVVENGSAADYNNHVQDPMLFQETSHIGDIPYNGDVAYAQPTADAECGNSHYYDANGMPMAQPQHASPYGSSTAQRGFDQQYVVNQLRTSATTSAPINQGAVHHAVANLASSSSAPAPVNYGGTWQHGSATVANVGTANGGHYYVVPQQAPYQQQWYGAAPQQEAYGVMAEVGWGMHAAYGYSTAQQQTLQSQQHFFPAGHAPLNNAQPGTRGGVAARITGTAQATPSGQYQYVAQQTDAVPQNFPQVAADQSGAHAVQLQPSTSTASDDREATSKRPSIVRVLSRAMHVRSFIQRSKQRAAASAAASGGSAALHARRVIATRGLWGGFESPFESDDLENTPFAFPGTPVAPGAAPWELHQHDSATTISSAEPMQTDAMSAASEISVPASLLSLSISQDTPQFAQGQVPLEMLLGYLFTLCPILQRDEITLIEQRGKGSFAQVYEGVYKGKPVAVKMLLKDTTSMDEEELKEFIREVDALCNLCHENIVEFLGVVTPDTSPQPSGSQDTSGRPSEHRRLWIVLEYCSHGNLMNKIDAAAKYQKKLQDALGHSSTNYAKWCAIRDRIQTNSIYPTSSQRLYYDWHLRLKLVYQVARSLAAMHRRGFIHRDLTSYNILLQEAPEGDGWIAKLADFNLCRFMPQGKFHAINSLAPHSPAFTPPELNRASVITLKADVYSLGKVIWSLLTLKHPPGQDDARQLAQYVLNATSDNDLAAIEVEMPTFESLDAPPPPEYTRDVHDSMCSIVSDCLERHQDARPHAAQVQQRLLSLLQGIGVLPADE